MDFWVSLLIVPGEFWSSDRLFATQASFKHFLC